MHIAFLTLQAREPLAYGLMSLTAVLRRAGHRVSFISGSSAHSIADSPDCADADVLAMSATTGLHRVFVNWARVLRKRFPRKAIVLGGPHPTFFPEVVLQAPWDGICIGEGEESFPEFLDAWKSGLTWVPAGWWIRRDGGHGPVVRGEERAPVRNLDSLPRPAYDVFYDADPHHRALPIRVFLATRGCPHRCTYCFNSELNDRYKPFGARLRYHDPERVADDITHVRSRWGGELAWFLDANFCANPKWLEETLAVYRRRVGLPFFCKLRPERATERVVSALANAGCTGVGIGIESGSELLRRTVLGREGTDAEILAGCGRLVRRGIRILAFNMLGIPGETTEDALRTLALNVACKVDYAGATILQPYPGTRLAAWAVKSGAFDGNFDRLSYSYFAPSPLRFPHPGDRDRLSNLQRLFALAVEFPEVRGRIRWLIDRPAQRAYVHLFQTRHAWAMQHTFYRAFRPKASEDAGSAEDLLRCCRDLGLKASAVG